MKKGLEKGDCKKVNIINYTTSTVNWPGTTSEKSKDGSLKIGSCKHDHPCGATESSSHSRPQPHMSPHVDPNASITLPASSSAQFSEEERKQCEKYSNNIEESREEKANVCRQNSLPSGSSASAGNNMNIQGNVYNVTGGNSTISGSHIEEFIRYFFVSLLVVAVGVVIMLAWKYL